MKLEENLNTTTKDARHYENSQNVFQKACIAVQCNCALCATGLVINVNRVTANEVKEEAFCPQCDLRMRSKVHTIQ